MKYTNMSLEFECENRSSNTKNI